MNLLERCLGVDFGWKVFWGGVGINFGFFMILVCIGMIGGVLLFFDVKLFIIKLVLYVVV